MRRLLYGAVSQTDAVNPTRCNIQKTGGLRPPVFSICQTVPLRSVAEDGRPQQPSAAPY